MQAGLVPSDCQPWENNRLKKGTLMESNDSSYLIANAGVTERCSKLAHAYTVATEFVRILSVANGRLFLAVEAVPSCRAHTSEYKNG